MLNLYTQRHYILICLVQEKELILQTIFGESPGKTEQSLTK